MAVLYSFFVIKQSVFIMKNKNTSAQQRCSFGLDLVFYREADGSCTN